MTTATFIKKPQRLRYEPAAIVARKPRRKMRKYTMEQRQQILAESHVAGATMCEVAERHWTGISASCPNSGGTVLEDT